MPSCARKKTRRDYSKTIVMYSPVDEAKSLLVVQDFLGAEFRQSTSTHSLSLHDALPISEPRHPSDELRGGREARRAVGQRRRHAVRERGQDEIGRAHVRTPVTQ